MLKRSERWQNKAREKEKPECAHAHEDFEFLRNAEMPSAVVLNILLMNWRVSPHCKVVNLVRSGRKQPQLFIVSAGGKARLLFGGVKLIHIAITQAESNVQHVR